MSTIPLRKLTPKKTVVRSVLLALAFSPAAVALAQGSTGIGHVTKFQAKFTTTRAGSAAGLSLRTTGDPPAQGVTEAPAVQQVVILPAGSKLHLARLPQCSASDAQIASAGAEGACPAVSRVGSGDANGLLNGVAVHFDIGIYAVRGHLVLAAEQGGKPLKQSFDGVAKGRRLILTVPTLGGRIYPTEFDAQIGPKPGGHTWLKTPPGCPASGHWVVVGKFRGFTSTTSDGQQVGATQTKTARATCRAKGH